MATAERLVRRIARPLRQRVDYPPTYIAWLGVIGGIGIATLAIHLVHLLVQQETLFATVLGTLLPASLSGVILAMAAWIHTREHEAVAPRAGQWCFVGTVVLIGLGVVTVASQAANGVMMDDLLFVTTTHATVGGAIGVLLGLYDGQRVVRGRELQRERERAQRYSNRLTIVNRVLRHDILTTVNIILGNTGLIRNGTTEVEASLATIEEKARNLQAVSETAKSLQQLLDGEGNQRSTIDIAPLLRAKLMKRNNEHPSVDIDMDVPETAFVRAVPQIDAALEELIDNAITHNDTASPAVSVSVSQAAGGDEVVIRIADNGPGIPDNEIEVLDRAYETDLKHLSGFGLWLVQVVVRESGGRIDFETTDPRGTVATVHLPKATDSTD